MCGSMADIQSAAAEIRRGKKKEEEERRRTNHSMKIYMVSLFHRATINNLSIYLSVKQGAVKLFQMLMKSTHHPDRLPQQTHIGRRTAETSSSV